MLTIVVLALNKVCRCFHLNGIIAVAKFSQGKAPNGSQTINILDHFSLMRVGKFEESPSKQIELNCKFCGSRAVNHSHSLMNCKDVQGIAFKVHHGDDVLGAYRLESFQGKTSFLPQGNVMTRCEEGVTEEGVKFGRGCPAEWIDQYVEFLADLGITSLRLHFGTSKVLSKMVPSINNQWLTKRAILIKRTRHIFPLLDPPRSMMAMSDDQPLMRLLLSTY